MRSIIAAAFALAFLGAAHAETLTLDLINEYPGNSITGEADAFFAQAVKTKTGGNVAIRPMPDAKSGLRTRDQLKAVSDGKFAMADSFAGALGDDSPVFLLSSLPFVTPSVRDARALYEAARPLYEQLVAERGQKLLFVVPWPPSGIWSAAPLSNGGALKALKIRTYDKTSTEVMSRVAASATLVSFADLTAKLESGDINAVLSSGDGGAGRALWKYLRHFSEVGYAAPLSFGTISLKVWSGLDDAGRAALEAAGHETSEHQWSALATRLSENYARMRANSVTIDEKPPADVMTALRTAADATIAGWLTRVPPDARKVLEDFRAGRGHSR
jgi:TRAP-type C4-dicarboxylate transport system substrate-binding protein